jgi:hypothetical protein
MIRQLATLVVCGVLGSVVLVGNAEACHKRNCGHAVAVCAPPCVKPAPCYKPAPCPPAPCVARTGCLPKIKLCNFKLPTLCHKKAPCAAPAPVAACAPAPVYYSYTYAAPAAYPTPQASAQH